MKESNFSKAAKNCEDRTIIQNCYVSIYRCKANNNSICTKNQCWKITEGLFGDI